MNTRCNGKRQSAAGYALLLTLAFLGILLVLLGSVMTWTSRESYLTARNNMYNAGIAAAEASTEMVIAQMDRDFLCQCVSSNLNVYRNLTPATVQSGWPVQFDFGDGSGNAGQTGVISLGPSVVTNLNSQFNGLYGMVMPFRVTAQAQAQGLLGTTPAVVSQDIQLASVPVFQMAIFYTLDLEINPGPAMLITGKVHSNGTIYTAPETSLEYRDAVTAVGQIVNNREINDPQYGAPLVAPVFDAQHMEKVSSLTLPVGTNNSPAAVEAILQPPPTGENPNSELGSERYYNKTDLIITTTTNGVQVTTGLWDNFSPVACDLTNASGTSYSFVNTSKSFQDLREGKNTIVTELDVNVLKNWMANPNTGGQINGLAQSLMGHQIDSVYINDKRTGSGKLTVARVVNGANLPANGLTVATQLPLYVQGNFNLNNGDTTVGQTNTTLTKPASLVGDAITILSSGWSDNDAGTTLSQRPAVNTTVNAALLGGIVQTTAVNGTKYYSGGVENFPRFLENWSGKYLTYNGSMVVMFTSQYANSFWKSPGIYYNPPNRDWAFDVNFLDQSKLPPATPQVRKLIRGQWNILTASN